MTIRTYRKFWGFVSGAGDSRSPVQPMETKGRGWLHSYDPDIVLSDVMMPGTSGVSLLRTLQVEDSNRPVILMTGYSTGDLAAAAIKDGALDLLSKPLDYPKLKSILEATRNSLKKSNDSHCN